MNRARSPQRLFETALSGTVLVASDLAPYDPFPDGEVLLKARTPEEWTDQVLRLVDDAALRRRIGEAARALVLAEHTIEARAPLWHQLVAEAGSMADHEAPAEAA